MSRIDIVPIQHYMYLGQKSLSFPFAVSGKRDKTRNHAALIDSSVTFILSTALPVNYPEQQKRNGLSSHPMAVAPLFSSLPVGPCGLQ